MKKFTLIMAVVCLPFLFSSCGYNQMVTMQESVDAQWANVENQYERRLSLYDNLVATVKGYADFEQETLTKVIEARASATQVKIDPSNITPQQLQQFQQAQGGLSGAISRLLLVIERYPDLKASQGFLEFQAQIEGTENRIAVERKKFNETARDYNTYIKQFPRVIYAGMFSFKAKPYFESTSGADKAPVVNFD
ncbi:MAG: LemA family protein [Bacteroidia bacterium]|nr:LemA family protein [Bacteroidia bacterium]